MQVDEEAPPEMPDAVCSDLQACLDRDERVASFVKCDLMLSGQFGETWLFATDRRLGLYCHEEIPAKGETRKGKEARASRQDVRRPILLRDLALSEVAKIERREIRGGALVEATTADGVILLARLTPGRLDDLAAALPLMQQLVPGASPQEEKPRWRRKKDKSKNVCPTCGKPTPPWSEICVDCLEKRKLLFRLLSRVSKYWPVIIVGLATMVIVQAADLAQPWLQAQLVDHAILGHNPGLLTKIIGALVGLTVLGQVVGGFRGYMMQWFGQKAIYDLRMDLYAHIQRLSVAFYDSKQTGWIMDRVTSDTMNLQDFLTDALQDFVRDSVTLLFILVIMLSWNWKLALLSLLPTPFIAYASNWFMHRSRRLYHRIWRKRSRISSLLTDVVPGVRVVKAFGSEEREIERFEARNRDFMTASVDAQRVFAAFGPITGMLTALGLMVVWGYGGYRAMGATNPISIGTLLAFMGYLYRFYQPVQSLSRMTQRFQMTATAAQRVFEVLDTPADVRDEVDAPAMPRIVGHIEFENVTFGYEPHQDVLKGVSFTAEPGEMVGLVGPSGAGKSTTINLVSRFYDVLDGAIRIDGIDIRDVTLDSLRSQIGVVLQEPFLFQGTLFDNIAYGNPTATRRQVIEAAKAANCHEFIMRFQDGYDTVVGERGTRLSGGERQRISIARAILKNPRILILDEATSSVDTETEGQIRQALDRLVEGRTTIAIAHRFSTLSHADKLIVLDKGKVVEVGSHEQLLAQEDGLFRRLSDQQTALARIVEVAG